MRAHLQMGRVKNSLKTRLSMGLLVTLFSPAGRAIFNPEQNTSAVVVEN
jgi:hypothetical protein